MLRCGHYSRVMTVWNRISTVMSFLAPVPEWLEEWGRGEASHFNSGFFNSSAAAHNRLVNTLSFLWSQLVTGTVYSARSAKKSFIR